MGVYLNISRHKGNDNYILHHSKIQGHYEVDLEQMLAFKEGESIDFKNGIFSIGFLLSYGAGEFGLYNQTDFLFYFFAMCEPNRKWEDGKITINAYEPQPILRVVDVAINNVDFIFNQIKLEEDIRKTELSNLVKLKEILEIAIKNEDLILVYMDG